jgi:hypothetical protein
MRCILIKMLVMKTILFFISLTVSFLAVSQCNQYFIYESFSTSLPTQQGTWVNTSVPYGTTAATARSGVNYLTFNAVNDAIRLPQISNPGVFSFYYRRSSTSSGTPKFSVETSTDGSVWTERLAVTSFSTTYALASVDLGALGLTNIFIRIIDRRASGNAERYVDDLGLTSTSASENVLIPFLTACNQTLDVNYTYTITDNLGPASGNYGGTGGNSLNRTLTFTPSDATKKLNLSFSSLDLETNYDYLYVYDGANTSATLVATLTGTTTPADITATNANGQLTVRWTTDVSNTGSWGGFVATLSVPVALPVELLYFEGVAYPTYNVLQWATASEHNSFYFDVERSTNGIDWKTIGTSPTAGNSNIQIDYSHSDKINQSTIHYYRLAQYDVDGNFKLYGPIVLNNETKIKTVIKHVNSLGQEVGFEHKGVVFEIYDDGTSKKIIR